MTISPIDPTVSTPDPLTGPRVEKWRWAVLDLNDNSLGYDLDGVESATLTFSIFNTIRGTGQMTWASGLPNDPNWLQIRLQPWYTAIFPDGSEMSWPLGVFIPATSKASWSDTGQSRPIALYDKLQILDANHVTATYTVPAGTVVTTAVAAVLADANQTKYAITPSTETVLTDMSWPVDTSHLKIANDLLASINYFSLYCDPNGWYRAEPYQDPSTRGVDRSFIDDDTSIFSPDFDDEFDAFDAPNEITCVSATDPTTNLTMTATAQNTDVNSPLSFPSRGVWMTRTDTDVAATSQAVLQAIADRRLAQASQVASTITLNHAPVPDVALNGVVAFRRQPADINIATAVVQSMQWSTSVGALVQTVIQEVAS